MDSYPHIGSVQEFNVTNAILLYKNANTHFGSNEIEAATVHDVSTVHGRLTIQQGSPITVDALQALATGLGRKLENCLLDERILSVSLGRMLWWAPQARRRIWFNSADKEKKATMKKVNGKIVAHPALLFAAEGSNLRVFALAENKRPTLGTKLYRAPYWNLNQTGLMCQGNVTLPSIASPALMKDFESGFFNSSFSHSHWGHALTSYPGGHDALWQWLATKPQGAKAPPWSKYLIGTKLTLNQLLNEKQKNQPDEADLEEDEEE